MKACNFILLLLFLFMGCDKNLTENNYDYRIVPDNTPMIMSLLEATNDTVHYFPEVVVGNVSDGDFIPDFQSVEDLSPLFNPTLWTQAVKTLQRFKLEFVGDENCKVIIRGPLDTDIEKKVLFTHLGNGIYGDVDFELSLIPGRKYQLSVIMSDGRSYHAESIIPEETKIVVPASMELDVYYTPYADGTPKEKNYPYKFIHFQYPKYTFVTEIQSNSNLDREILLLDPWEEFLFKDRGNYLRLGTLYDVSTSQNLSDSLRRTWLQDLNKPREEIWNEERKWMRFSFFSDGIGGGFMPMSDIFTSNGDQWGMMIDKFINAYLSQDSTYLFDISTIQKMNESGKVLSKDKSDAIGFFGGYFSVYKTTVLYPIRKFNLDSILTANGY